MIHNLAVGLAALLLAALAALCAIAIGEPITRKVDNALLKLAAAMISGFGVVSFAVAATIWWSTALALVVQAVVSIGALAANHRGLLSLLRSAKAEAASAIGESRLVRGFLAIAAVLYGLDAIAPPRDGDVVRYHLAHIAQIIKDGSWHGIADYHYALPFGWTLNYLPFEAMGLPQGVHMLNALIIFVIVLIGLSVARRLSRPRAAVVVPLLFLLHPAVLKAGTTAFADAYTLLAILVATVLIGEWNRSAASPHLAFLAGFASWIGIQSRYQLIGFGVAATLGFLVSRPTSATIVRGLLSFALGAVAALTLASPFYLMNLHEFGNPVWPFFVAGGANEPYVNVVGAAYQRSQTGEHSLRELFYGLRRLATYRDMIPIPFAVLFGIVIGWIRFPRALRTTLIVTTAFVVLWMVAQPTLYGRFVLYFLPLAMLLWIEIMSGAGNGGWKLAIPAMSISAILLLSADIAYSADNLRFVATRDTPRFHRYTWYYPVYRWVNANTPRDARFAVIVWSGYSYYLDRQYRRADPWLAGEIDWNAIDGAEKLEKTLADRRIDFLIYDDRNWSFLNGGKNMTRAIHSAIESGALVPVRKFHERLYTSRLKGSYRESDVYVLRTRASLTSKGG